jgi:hypothetical protein
MGNAREDVRAQAEREFPRIIHHTKGVGRCFVRAVASFAFCLHSIRGGWPSCSWEATSAIAGAPGTRK